MNDLAQPLSPDAVLFDCDGVVLDSEVLWDQAEVEFLARRGIVFDSARTKPLITGLGMTAGILLLQEQYGLDGNIEDLSRERIEIVRGLFERELRFTEGFLDFFETKIRGRFRTCIATSMSAEIFAVADQRLGISPLFAGRVYFPSHVGGRAKPEPDLFLYAADQLATTPERCVVIEDSPRGIEAGRRAGMRVIGLATTHPQELIANADVVVGSFAEMDALF